MKKNVLKLLALLLALLAPACALLTLLLAVPPQYDRTFLGELSDKYERLCSTDEPKIVLIGGSSVAFGYDTKLMQEHLGMPVVNFGLYATLGTKVMLDLSRKNIGNGDIVVIAPEMDKQTLSLYFNGESVWQAADSDLSILGGIDFDNYDEMLGSLWQHLVNKLRLWRTGKPDPDGVYSESAFDEYGDIVYARPSNIMTVGYQGGSEISLVPQIVSSDFIDYVNEYVRYAEERGARVYFSFSPMNASAMAPDTTEQSLYDFYLHLDSRLDCPIITNPSDCILDERYFYDSNFHLNDAGVVVRSATMISDLRRYLGLAPVTIELPEPPSPAPSVTVLDDPAYSEDADCFLYREENGTLTVVGLSETGKTRTRLTVPAMVDGTPVTVLGDGGAILSGASALTTLTVNENISYIAAGAFGDCASLRTVILNTCPAKTGTDFSELLEGAGSALRLRAKKMYSADFGTDYFWAKYYARFDFI